MTLNWYNVINLDDFIATGLTSREVTMNIDGVGERDIMITKGIGYGILYDGIFLPIQLNDMNPFVFDNTAVYLDEANDVWLGVLGED